MLIIYEMILKRNRKSINDLKIGRYSMQLTIMVLIKTIRVNIDI